MLACFQSLRIIDGLNSLFYPGIFFKAAPSTKVVPVSTGLYVSIGVIVIYLVEPLDIIFILDLDLTDIFSMDIRDPFLLIILLGPFLLLFKLISLPLILFLDICLALSYSLGLGSTSSKPCLSTFIFFLSMNFFTLGSSLSPFFLGLSVSVFFFFFIIPLVFQKNAFAPSRV